MSDEPYLRLREFLDLFPLGFPATDSGVELRILRRLFTVEEAETAVLLTPFPEEASQVATRAGVPVETLETRLAAMAEKGLVFRVRREGKTLYGAAPFMIGLYEYSVEKIDNELAGLYRQYYEEAYLDEMGASNVPGFKVLPINESVEAETVLYPFLDLVEQVKAARKISVADCVCRKESRLLGQACDYPLETCLSFGAAAEYYIETGIGREVSVEEAIEILRDADRAGLIHAGTNTKHLSNICNCCPCCCASMKGITQRGHDKHRYLNALFEAVVDEDACTGCEECTDRCPVGAMEFDGTARADRDSCLGCGLCAGVCAEGAITIMARADMEEPFDRVLYMGMAILDGKLKAGGRGT
jgi:H+/Na+-translocating ferredoxin:NAD+ oxidoreductase subunit B